MRVGAVEEGALILAVVAAVAVVSVVHQSLLTPCTTSSAPPQVVTCDVEASFPTEVQEVADGDVAHCCCYTHKETCPSFS